MYKRTIQELKGRNEEYETDYKIKLLENSVTSADADINLYIQKIEGMKRVKKGQDKVIEKDINDELKGGVVSMKKEMEDIKKILKEYTKRDRNRDVNYKRQQAYLFEVEKKTREVSGDYFPELKKKQAGPAPINSRVTKINKNQATSKFTIDEYFDLQQELNELKRKHE